MTSNPRESPPDWPVSGPTASEPLDALPLTEDGFPVPDGRWHTGPLGPVHTGPLSRVQTGPLSRVQTGPQDPRQAGPQVRAVGSGRRPATRAPWPGPDGERSARVVEHETGNRLAVAAPEPASGAASGDERLAALGYLSVPFLGPLVPLVVYLAKRQASGYARRQSAQALNLSITALLYTLCALILGAMLALDSVTVALLVVLPLVAALWLVSLVYVILAASQASRGGFLRIPGWLCATILH